MFNLDPNVWYDENTLRVRGIDAETLRKARDAGQLRSRMVGRLRYYKGEWLSKWLESVEDGHDRRA